MPQFNPGFENPQAAGWDVQEAVPGGSAGPAAPDGMAAYIPLTQKGAVNGVAALDGASRVPRAQVYPNALPAAYTQTYAAVARTHPALVAAAAPAGGVGAAAGGWDTAANRDAAIATINNLRADLIAVKDLLNSVIDDLQASGILQ